MNKIIKGSIAGAAGIALLLGGAGTFALWNSSTNVSLTSISSGELSLDASTPAAGAWYDITKGPSTTPITAATYKIVPGASLEFRKVVNIKAVGDNLAANFAVAGGTVTSANSQAAKYQTSTKVNYGGTDYQTPAVVPVTAGSTSALVTYKLVFTAGTATPGDNTTQKDVLTLSDLAVTLTQVAP